MVFVYRVKLMLIFEVFGEKLFKMYLDFRYFEEIYVVDIKCVVDGLGLKGKCYIYDIKLFYV